MTDTATVDGSAVEEHDAHHGPTDKLLIQIAVILAVVTAVEVAWSYLPWPDETAWFIGEVLGLVVMMAFKFYVVAAYFMHLKWDKKLLTGIFYAGLALAIAVYLAVLFTFEFFSGNWA
jgi:cytochrome c oxidase subunit IV